MITKCFCPLIRQSLPPLACNIYRFFHFTSKSLKNKALTTATRTELDTNVKHLGERVKQTTKTASYLGIIVVGIGITGTLFYAVLQELFSNKSPNSVYSSAAKRCIDDTRVQDALGMPITSYGETTRRGRRQHVSHLAYQRNGKKCLRMKFYLHGSFRKGTAQLDMIEVRKISYKFRRFCLDSLIFLYSLIY